MNSIFQQDYTNWEIVVISDDGSDYERVLADQGIRNDKIHFESTGKTASGAGNARNVGLAHAKGDFIALLDSDDRYDANRISTLLPLAQKFGAAMSQVEMINDATGEIIPNLSIVIEDERMLPDQAVVRSFHAMSTAIFDRAKITHHYQPVQKLEDNVFLMQMYNSVDVIGFSNTPSYKYYKYPGTTTAFSPDTNTLTDSFAAVAGNIRQQVLDGKIYMKHEHAKRALCDQMAFIVESQAFFANEAIKTPEITYLQAMTLFLNQHELTAARRSAG